MALMLAMVLAAAVPALAQAGAVQYDPAGPETVKVTFELRAECRPPTGTDLLGASTLDLGDVGPVERVWLTDPDGDGTYVGSMDVPTGVVLVGVWIAQGVERQDGREGSIPGESSAVIEHFGTMTIEEAKTFTASVSFCDSGGSNQYSSGGQYDPGSGGTVSAPSSGNGTSLAQLPATGGALLTLGVGALLVGGGLLIRKIFQ